MGLVISFLSADWKSFTGKDQAGERKRKSLTIMNNLRKLKLVKITALVSLLEPKSLDPTT